MRLCNSRQLIWLGPQCRPAMFFDQLFNAQVAPRLGTAGASPLFRGIFVPSQSSGVGLRHSMTPDIAGHVEKRPLAHRVISAKQPLSGRAWKRHSATPDSELQARWAEKEAILAIDGMRTLMASPSHYFPVASAWHCHRSRVCLIFVGRAGLPCLWLDSQWPRRAEVAPTYCHGTE